MTPDQLKAWVGAAQLLIAVGVNLVSSLKSLLGVAHPDLTPEQLNAAYVAILTDNALRAAFAAQAAVA